MAEPSTTSLSLTALFIALLGPLAGQYSLIVMAALAGALWPLSTMSGTTRMGGAWFLLRVVLTAVFLSGAATWFIETKYKIPAHHSMAVVAFMIGALGNGWEPVFKIIRSGVAIIAGRVTGQSGDQK